MRDFVRMMDEEPNKKDAEQCPKDKQAYKKFFRMVLHVRRLARIEQDMGAFVAAWQGAVEGGCDELWPETGRSTSIHQGLT